ncbi:MULTISPECIES: acyl-CoA thioesterase [Actinomadura]|uniref:Acyl-CoA thioester hydrolase n=1 Tax=Actinomadura madurae TaxID=1993 RepID=A0A1I4ZNF6_9ACTN|nr:thioesterase family protein [Actinomadura madurae]MCP9949110.1 acyl-CoA thioesterase [Actinomadura madurae]MCP9965873.1 acyl-CoA thioesterase [Actinomadura madurae]MCP9978351.1 acyl-CoA thioesterase [Actinomadura madurae]MCQ0010127.1 acyl-CoA thioesterase [Actinomadura madurae]MCQ0014558.1 acyl-CoA thioesterase [Actinomadura madurae]
MGEKDGDFGFVHRVRVRYADCDMQGVVFNANYFAYIDDAMDMWLQHALGEEYLDGFDYAVKKAGMEWDSPARVREVVDLRPAVTRWGRTSFDVRIGLSVGDRALGVGELVLVSVTPGGYEPSPVPERVRRALK